MMTESLPADVLAALDILVLEQVNEQSLKIVGTIPTWFTHLYPQITNSLERSWITDHLPFLSNFLTDAAEFWHEDQPGIHKSGLWCEKDDRDQDIHLEASALKIGQKPILLIKASLTDYAELFSLIQKARESTLDFIDERKQASENILKTTFYDSLTGLPNQTYFLIQLAQAFEQYKRQENYHLPY